MLPPQSYATSWAVELNQAIWLQTKQINGFAAGKFKLIGSRDLHLYAPDEIKRVRVVRRADGYYAQFCINVERKEEPIPTGKTIGIDVGLNQFYTDSKGEIVPSPRYFRQSEKALKRLQKRVSREEERF